MKPLQLLLLMVCCCIRLQAQNLVVNGSFEDENRCTEFEKNCSPEGWIISSLESHFYFDDVAVAWEGRHFVGLVAGMNGRWGSRNFITSQMVCGLRKGAWYALSFYLLPGTEMTDSVGVSFSADDLLYRKAGLKGVVPSLIVTNAVLTGKGQWRKYTALYQAKDGEAFISIGIFKKTPPEKIHGAIMNPKYYFYLDSVSVIPVNPKEKFCPGAAAMKEELYNRNERHTLLDRGIYVQQRRPPVMVDLPKTTLLKIDTLIIPDVLFATNSYTLTPKALYLLDSFSKSVRNKLVDSVVVEGHTDNRGGKPLNIALSKNRAASVTAQLQQVLGATVPMQQRGWADQKPVADNTTAAGRQRNRRVEIYLYLRE